MPLKRDEAKDDMVQYHRALIHGLTSKAIAIEHKHGFFGLPPMLVSIGLQALSEGRDPWAAIEQPLEANDDAA